MDQEAVDGIEASAITRGRVLTTVAFLLAIGAAVTLLTLVLLGLEYDFDDGILDPFDPAWAPLLVLGAAISAPIVLLSMKPWTRWPVGVGFALGSAWLLLKADFGDEHLPATMALAAAWAVTALLLTVPHSVGVYLRRRTGHLERLLGPLDGEEAARRWLAAAAQWEHAGVLTRRERRHLREELSAWMAAGEASEEIQRAVAGITPAPHELSLLRRLMARFRAASPDDPQVLPEDT